MLKDNPRLARLVSGLPERVFLNSISKAQHVLLGQHKDGETVRLIKRVRKERTCLMTSYECYTLHSIAKAYAACPEAMAEVGCFQGTSTKLICEACGGADSRVEMHVFDTFEGLPKSSEQDRGVHEEKQYSCSLDSVKEYLSAYKNLQFHKGIFPESSGPVKDLRFSFVNCDVDLYEGTLGCLEFFYPRLIPGGVLISHDYSTLAGVKQAFKEFLSDKLEKEIELPSTQCMLVKL